MPQDNQDLFNVMDSALKRQGEGASRRFRAVNDERTQSARHTKASSRRTAAEPEPAASPAMPAAPAMPSAPAVSEPPAAPAAPAAARAPEPTMHVPDYQRAEGQPHTADITRRLYPMPESARVLPAGGSLSPGQVLRGTVFSGNRFRPQPGQPTQPTAPEPQPPMEELQPPVEAAAPQQPAAPFGPPSTRQAPARGIASVALRSRPSALLTPSVRPSGMLASPAGPAQYERPAASHPTGGFFVRTEVASVVLLFVVIGLAGAFLIGHRMGESSAQRKSGPDKGKIEKPQYAAKVPAAVDLESPPPSAAPATPAVPPAPAPAPAAPAAPAHAVTTPPVAAPPAATAPATGKYALRVRSYNDRNSAEKMAGILRGKGLPDVRVVPKSGVFMVLVGHFNSKTDPEATAVRRRVLGQAECKGFLPEVIQG